MKPYPLNPATRLKTLRELVDWSAEQYGQKPAFVYDERKERISVSYAQFLKDVRRLAAYINGLHSENNHIALFGENSYLWIVTYFAITYCGHVVVPLDKDMPKEELPLRLKDSDSDILFLSDTYSDYRDVCAETQTVLLSETRQVISESKEAGARESAYPSPDASTLASIVFTSGTTGSPKGVMLSQGNFASDLWGACCNVHLDGNGLLLLPLHHTFGLVASLLACLYYGKSLFINRSLRNIASDLTSFKPQHIFAVPLVVESLYRNIWANAAKQKKDKLLKTMLKVSDSLYKIHIDLRRKLFSSVLNGLGGELSLLVSGGAPIDQKYIDFFTSIGITILNGYGITECAPVVAVNRNFFQVQGSVGPILPCNEVKIAPDGEVCVRGDNVMLGYYKNEAATRECMEDGWFKTGDLGKVDQFNALHITGRKKNLIILSNGENISAEELEELILNRIDYVREVVVSASPKGIAAECYLDPEKADARLAIKDDIAKLNRTLVPNKRISEVMIRETEFPKTTTKKIIREKR